MGTSSTKIAFEFCVVSGDFRGGGLGPGINMIMFDEKGSQSPAITLTSLFSSDSDFRQAKFTIDLQPWSRVKAFGRLHHLEFWRGDGGSDIPDWYLDRVIVRDRRFGLTGEWDYFFFPMHEWIAPDTQYVVHNYETFLPANEPFPDLRDAQLFRRIQQLNFTQRARGLPVELNEIPATEIFSFDAQWDIEEVVLQLIEASGMANDYCSEESWDSFDSIGNIYKKYNITEPLSLSYWMINDVCFGAQRTRGCNPFTLRRCVDLPPAFAVLEDCLKPYLEGWTLRQMLAAHRLFYVDHYMMGGLHCRKDRYICSPLALFFYTEKRQLRPLAIQLFHEDDEDPSPVFLPSDPVESWLQAKLWFNMVDACHHMVAGRLLTHMILESMYVSMRRNMAQSHPVYQLLAPHFRSILPVTRKLKEWILENGWIARNIQLSKKGIRQLLKRAFKEWKFDVQTSIYGDLKNRMVQDKKSFGNYPFRDDAILLHELFDRYVSKYLRLRYPRGQFDLLNDTELQAWRQELANPMESGGLGLRGVPGSVLNSRPGTLSSSLSGSHRGTGDDTVFDTTHCLNTMDEARKFVSGILYLAVVVAGSALRLPMYDEYGFILQYPLSLFGEPPIPLNDGGSAHGSSVGLQDLPQKSVDTILSSIPNRRMTMETVLYNRIGSRIRQSALGEFDSDFLFDPKAVTIVEEWREELAEASRQIALRNKSRDQHHQYFALDPALMPNYPGI